MEQDERKRQYFEKKRLEDLEKARALSFIVIIFPPILAQTGNDIKKMRSLQLLKFLFVLSGLPNKL